MNESDARPLQRLLDEKAAAERAGDLDAILRVFVPEPVIEFFPIGRRLRGADQVGQFYRHMMKDFMPRIVSVDPGISISDGVHFAKEQELTLHIADGEQATFRMLVISGVEEGRLWGQRYYGSERFYFLLVGDLLDGE